MKRSSNKRNRNLAFFAAFAAISVGALGGCELLVDFDRTLIDGGSLGEVDGSGFDATGLDSSSEASASDAGDASDSGNVTDGDASSELDGDAGVDADM